MKTIFTLILQLGIMGSLMAQIPLNPAILPVIGDTVELYFSDTTGVNEGPAGNNQSWDFSQLKPTVMTQRIYLASDSTPYGNLYPAAGICRMDDQGALYTYWNRAFNKFEYHGFVQPFVVDQFYSDPAIYFEFPVRYNDQRTDSIYVFTNPGNLQSPGILYFHADGYGTLTLPRGKALAAYRIKTTTYIGDSTIQSYELNTEYSWYDNKHKDLLLAIGYTNINGFESKYVIFSNDSIPPVNTGIYDSKEAMNLSVYPNPFTDKITVEGWFSNPVTGYFLIQDMEGREVFKSKDTEWSIGEIKATLNVAHLNAGIYFISFKGRNTYFTQKLIKL
jgi:Secretion system C-terminal sorting domain